jgi:hypothetical protein
MCHHTSFLNGGAFLNLTIMQSREHLSDMPIFDFIAMVFEISSHPSHPLVNAHAVFI